MSGVIVAHVPALHRGYREFFTRWQKEGADTLYILGHDILARFDETRKDLRALEPDEIVAAVRSWGIFAIVETLDRASAATLPESSHRVIMPEDDISLAVAQQFFLRNTEVVFDSVFLRWDRSRTTKQDVVVADRTITLDELHEGIVQRAFAETRFSSNWWRRVGAVAFRDGKILLAAGNPGSVPYPETVWQEGDPRIHFERGNDLDQSLDPHAEALIVAAAAAQGIVLAGADVFVTMFPCPPCAKILAYAGMRRVYFAEGYSVIDAQRILHQKGVELIHVTGIKAPTVHTVQYPERSS
jgi:dCMP deaminase